MLGLQYDFRKRGMATFMESINYIQATLRRKECYWICCIKAHYYFVPAFRILLLLLLLMLICNNTNHFTIPLPRGNLLLISLIRNPTGTWYLITENIDIRYSLMICYFDKHDFKNQWHKFLRQGSWYCKGEINTIFCFDLFNRYAEALCCLSKHTAYSR